MMAKGGLEQVGETAAPPALRVERSAEQDEQLVARGAHAERVAPTAAGAPPPAAQAGRLSAIAAARPSRLGPAVRGLQRAYGNRYVAGLLQRAPLPDQAAPLRGAPEDEEREEPGPPVQLPERPQPVPTTDDRRPSPDAQAGGRSSRRHALAKLARSAYLRHEGLVAGLVQRTPDAVVRMEIEPRSRRAVLILDTGARQSGTVETDLAPGRYQLSANPARRRWNIAGSRAGQRFNLTLEGADPWSLAYASSVELVVSEEPTLGLAEIQTRLGLLDSLLTRLATSHAPTTELRDLIARGRASLATFRNQLHGLPDDVRALLHAEDVVERVERALLNLDRQRLALVDRPDYFPALDRVRRLYIEALAHLFQPDLTDVFNQAERGAQGLPRALIEVDLGRVQQHAELNREYLIPSEQLFQWVQWVRNRLDAFEAQTRALEEARQRQDPDLPARTRRLEQEGQLIQLSIEGLGHFDTALRAREHMIRQRVLDPVLTAAMNRIMDRVRAIMAASQGAELATLQARVTRHREDTAITDFYRALPAMINVSRLVTALAVAFVASWAAASVGGLVGGAATRALVTGGGLTTRGALAIGGAVTLEALTFTLVSQGLGHVLLGQNPSGRDLLVDFAWSLGLFSVLRGLSVGIGRGLHGTSVAPLSGPIQMAGSFPILQGYGMLRFRVESGRWPSSQELEEMTAHNLLMMAGLAVGMRAVQRWIPTGGRRPTALQLFRQEYGWRFEAIDAGRQRLVEELGQLVRAGRATDQAALDQVRPRARILEEEFSRILAEAQADRNINLAEIRTQLKQARTTVIEGQSELLARELGLAEETGLRSAGTGRAYTYSPGKTNDLEGRLRALGARVTKTQDQGTGLRTLTAEFGTDPPLTFRERQLPTYGTREISIDASHPAVQDLFARFAIADPLAQQMVVEMMTFQLAREPTRTTEWAAQQVQGSLNRMRRAAPAGRTVEELVLELRRRGIIASTVAQALLTRAQELVAAGILRSEEWLSARNDDNFLGVVGEWLGRSVVQAGAPAGARTLRNVHFVGDVFIDAQGTRPRQMSSGRPMVNTDIAELDYMVASQTGGPFEVHSVVNVKGVAGRGGEGVTQNELALSCIRTQRGELFPIQDRGQTYYARLRSVNGVDAATNQAVDLSALREAPGGARAETLGPQGARGYSGSLGHSAADILTLARLLREIQMQQTRGN